MQNMKLANWLLGGADGSSAPQTTCRVIVIGAGMAGLITARLLQESGFGVIVLEARNRLGGRIWTDDALGAPLDMGASFIHGADNNPLTNWCEQLGVPYHILERTLSRYYHNGAFQTWDELLLQAHDSLMRLQEAISAVRALPAPDQPTIAALIAEFLQSAPVPLLDQQLIAWQMGVAEGVQAATADQLGVQWWSPKELMIVNALLPSGYRQLIEDVAQGLDVRLNTPVVKVTRGATGVDVFTSAGHFHADKVIVTASLGVLKAGKIAFDPSLPVATQQAIERIGYGNGVLNKIYLRFSQDFWPTLQQRAIHLPMPPARRGIFSSWYNLAPLSGKPILVSFSSGPNGVMMDREWSDAQIVAAAMENLRAMFGDVVPEPEQFAITRWLSDAWALGSYSYAQLGSDDTAERLALAVPIDDQLYFAGEATDVEDFGTVHAALRSGERVACIIYEQVTGRMAVTGNLIYWLNRN